MGNMETVRIVQITDSHLVPTPGLWKNRLDTAGLLARAVSRINAIGADLVVHTGDLIDDGTLAATARGAEILSRLEAPLRICPGNHDDRSALRNCFPLAGFIEGAPDGRCDWTKELGGLRVAGLDTITPGATQGRLDDAGAQFLEDALSFAGPTLLFCHHPPAPLGLPFMEQWPFEGAERAAEILSLAPPLRVACGHVHCARDRHVAGTLISACPPLAPAIPPDARPGERPGLLLEPPALRLHEWDAELGLRVTTLPLSPGPGPFFW